MLRVSTALLLKTGKENPQDQHQLRESKEIHKRNEIVIITDGRWKKPLDS